MNKLENICVGVYAPSHPAHIWFIEKYELAKENLRKYGFKIVEGDLIKEGIFQGYRTSTARERANEFMGLINNPDVNIIIPVKGGCNSASLLPYLDYKKIAESKKIICGYSDITALHMAILKKSNIPTLYGPSIVQTFGEYEGINEYTWDIFKNLLQGKSGMELYPPDLWSNEFLDAFTDEWKNKRNYKKNSGWNVLKQGDAVGRVIVANINTLVSLLGTQYVPSFKDSILILEESNARIDVEERNLNALKLSGIFEGLKGLVFSKPEVYNDLHSGFQYEELLNEYIENVNCPIISNFDCGHTIPMISIPQLSEISLKASDKGVKISIEKNSLKDILY